MEKSKVISIRSELHHLAKLDRYEANGNSTTINIPLIVTLDNSNTLVDEMASCLIWDDANEILYSIEYNNNVNDPLGEICPMRIRTFSYEVITSITARVDMNCLMNFFDDKISKSLTTKTVKEKYRNLLQENRDPRTYAMGMPSTTTSKGLIEPDAVIMNKTAYECL